MDSICTSYTTHRSFVQAGAPNEVFWRVCNNWTLPLPCLRGGGMRIGRVQGYLAHKKPLTLGPYSRPMPRALWWFYGGGGFL